MNPAAPVDGPTPDLVARLATWLHKWPGGAPNEVWSLASEITVQLRAATTHNAIVGALDARWQEQEAALTAARTEAERARQETKLDNEAWKRDADRLRVAESALAEARQESERLRTALRKHTVNVPRRRYATYRCMECKSDWFDVEGAEVHRPGCLAEVTP